MNSVRTLLCILLLLLPVQVGAQIVPPCASLPRDELAASTMHPVSNSALPAFSELAQEAGVEDTVHLRMTVLADGRVEPGSVCAVAESSVGVTSFAAQMVGRWRFQATTRGTLPERGRFELKIRFSLADSARLIPGRPATLAHVAPLRREGDAAVLTVPVLSTRFEAGALRPAGTIAGATRDSAELALFLTLIPHRAPQSGAWCVSAELGSRILAELQRAGRAIMPRGDCERVGTRWDTAELRWGDPATGVTSDGVLLVKAALGTRDMTNCAGNYLCGSGKSDEYDCAVARAGAMWVALCRSTWRTTVWVS